MARRRRSLNKADAKLARQRAKVRFGPEHSTINALVGEAQSNLASDLSSADAAAKSAIHFTKKAKKPVAAVFNAARSEADAARSDVESAFGKLGAAADPFRAVTAREQAGRAQRIASAGADALHELTQRQLEAKAGGQYAKTQAKQEYRKNIGDLSQRLYDLGDREGAFIAAEAGGLKQARAGRKATSRVKRMDIKADKQAADTDYERDVAKIKLADSLKDKEPGSKGLPKGTKPASRSEMKTFRNDISKALKFTVPFGKSDKVSRPKADTLLTGGLTREGKQNVPAISDQLARSVALDIGYDGHVSRANARAMKEMGLRVADIPGLTSYTDWKRKQPKVSYPKVLPKRPF